MVSKPIINLGNDTIIFPNQNISLNGGVNFTEYYWDGTLGEQFYNISATTFGIGIHKVTLEAINEFGCIAFDTIEITITEFGFVHDASPVVGLIG